MKEGRRCAQALHRPFAVPVRPSDGQQCPHVTVALAVAGAILVGAATTVVVNSGKRMPATDLKGLAVQALIRLSGAIPGKVLLHGSLAHGLDMGGSFEIRR
jgi:hypothetical protein